MKLSVGFILVLLIFQSYGELSFKDAVPFKYSQNGEQITAVDSFSRYLAMDFIDYDNDNDYDFIGIDYKKGDVVFYENIGSPEKHEFKKTTKQFTVGGDSLKVPING